MIITHIKNVKNRLSVHPVYSKVYNWSKLVTITGSAQVLVQVASLVCGILIIRLLPTEEYALYTLVNTMLGTMTILSDGGISAGVMSIGGKVWQDSNRLGTILFTGLKLRRKFAVGSLAVAIPILSYLLLHHGASKTMVILIVISLIPSFIAALSDSILEIVPKLQQDIKTLQKNQVTVGILRLALNTVLVFIFPFAFIAVISNGLPRIYGNYQLRKVNRNYTNKQKIDKAVERDILKVVKRILPSSIYSCFISQISIWLISISGSTSSVAQVGALGRLGIALNVFSVMINTLATPRFAKLAEEKKTLWLCFAQVIGSLFLLCLFIVGTAAIFPQQILLLLGKEYINLHQELILSVTVSCLGLIYSTIHSLCLARGYVIKPIANIGIHLLVQVILIFSMNLSTVKNVFIFSIIESSVLVVMFTINFFYFTYRIKSLN